MTFMPGLLAQVLLLIVRPAPVLDLLRLVHRLAVVGIVVWCGGYDDVSSWRGSTSGHTTGRQKCCCSVTQTKAPTIALSSLDSIHYTGISNVRVVTVSLKH